MKRDKERDALIVAARKKGATVKEIARAAGVNEKHVRRALKRNQG